MFKNFDVIIFVSAVDLAYLPIFNLQFENFSKCELGRWKKYKNVFCL